MAGLVKPKTISATGTREKACAWRRKKDFGYGLFRIRCCMPEAAAEIGRNGKTGCGCMNRRVTIVRIRINMYVFCGFLLKIIKSEEMKGRPG
ncbi:MAG: hypothetical protein LIP10_08765 [Clostridiales bacterium]|nr:hypothetical protein [Clostridiales bacterium]